MGAQKQILVVDGDADWRQRIVDSLAGPQLELTAMVGGDEALEHARREKPDLIVMELQLPELSGLGLCRLVREDPALSHTGLVMVTGHTREIDRILAFEAGIDDLLAKPFFSRELASRVAAVLRRATPKHPLVDPDEAPCEGLVRLDGASGIVTVSGRRLDLTPREHQLLAALIRQVGRVLTRKQLLTRVWGTDTDHTDRVVDAHIKSIRRKLEEAKICIETVRGVGYRFSEDRVPTFD